MLRFQVNREVVLFNARQEEKMYKIVKIGDNAVHIELVTEMIPKTPKYDTYLCFALLKKDKNDWVLQKATELGVRHFIPILAARTEKTGFDVERAEKIVIEAAEQSGRADIPRVREPLGVASLIDELQGKVDLYYAEQNSPRYQTPQSEQSSAVGVLVGPEGGWETQEVEMFKQKGIKPLGLSDFTLRAETAAIVASSAIN